MADLPQETCPFIKNVNLESEETDVQVDTKLISSSKIAEEVDNIGTKFNASSISKTCYVHIEGMSCQSCVRNITGKVEAIDGVKICDVSLEKKLASIEFDPQVKNPENFVKFINEIGTKFTASLESFSTIIEITDEDAKTQASFNHNK